MAGSGTTSPPAYPSAVASPPSSSRSITLPRTHSDDEPRPRIAKSGYLPVVLFLPCFTGSTFPRRFRSSPTPIDSGNTPTVKPLLLPISLSGLVVRMSVDPRNPKVVRHDLDL